MNLNRNQLSLLITVFSLSIVVLLLFNVHLGAGEEDEYVIELSLADEDLQELLEQEEQKQQELNADPIKSHMALNEAAKPTIEEPEPFKTLEEIMAEKAMAEDTEGAKDFLSSADGYNANLQEMLKQRELNKQKLEELEAKKKEFTNNLKDRRPSVTYSLVDRQHYEVPPPIYTCIEGGTVVINIKVDGDGYVREALFNSKSSNTTNGCLVDNAISYALKARFDPAAKALQIGTITYVFQSK
ncbi:hypothetical protein [Lentiprolixibacter aurantiacus]|uniref:Energy transducer TonB n=1 Tax=Lentiprolixibacter aurantiacus TaxID=2993939 RepID=A0AAE3MIV0_9FLAO|nr:hypothetical protein [Lentiprolixibacter aurantiacus]MCX2718234.1 hypothetical protein [Lentiprolixibacter aurantiacus]